MSASVLTVVILFAGVFVATVILAVGDSLLLEFGEKLTSKIIILVVMSVLFTADVVVCDIGFSKVLSSTTEEVTASEPLLADEELIYYECFEPTTENLEIIK